MTSARSTPVCATALDLYLGSRIRRDGCQRRREEMASQEARARGKTIEGFFYLSLCSAARTEANDSCKRTEMVGPEQEDDAPRRTVCLPSKSSALRSSNDSSKKRRCFILDFSQCLFAIARDEECMCIERLKQSTCSECSSQREEEDAFHRRAE